MTSQVLLGGFVVGFDLFQKHDKISGSRFVVTICAGLDLVNGTNEDRLYRFLTVMHIWKN